MSRLKQEYEAKFNQNQTPDQRSSSPQLYSASDENFSEPNPADFDEYVQGPARYQSATRQLQQFQSIRVEDVSSSYHEKYNLNALRKISTAKKNFNYPISMSKSPNAN